MYLILFFYQLENSIVPTLVALANGNKIFIIQNDQIKVSGKEIDVSNLNIIDSPVFNVKDKDNSDVFGLH